MFFRLCWRAPRTLMLEMPMNNSVRRYCRLTLCGIGSDSAGAPRSVPEFTLNGSEMSGRGRAQFYSRILMVNTGWSQREVKWQHQNRRLGGVDQGCRIPALGRST